MIRVLFGFCSVCCFIFMASCEKDESRSMINPSSSVIVMEGEGGRTDIAFDDGDWEIICIHNQSGEVKISGNSYDLAGQMIRENYILSLEGTGRLESFWRDKGFQIDRPAPNSLEIFLEENGSGEDFHFFIVLQSGDQTREIEVRQKPSLGYDFDRIEYHLEEGDGDSFFLKRGTKVISKNATAHELTFSPFNGIDVDKNAYFESEQTDAFVWTEKDSVVIRIPTAILEDEVLTNEMKMLYTPLSVRSEHDFLDITETVMVPEGYSEFYTEIEFRKRKVSYTLHLLSRRTKEPKVIRGKWIEYAPTGNYKVVGPE